VKHANAYPLSISMPLVLAEHANAKIDSYRGGSCPTTKSCSIIGLKSSMSRQETHSV
jgi:hypothetical protein